MIIDFDYINNLLNKADEAITEEVKAEEVKAEAVIVKEEVLDFDEAVEKAKEEKERIDGEIKDRLEVAKMIVKEAGLEGVEFERIYNWLYIWGDTYKARAGFKEAGFKWFSKKKCWCYIPEGCESTKRSRKTFTREELEEMHPTQKLD